MTTLLLDGLGRLSWVATLNSQASPGAILSIRFRAPKGRSMGVCTCRSGPSSRSCNRIPRRSSLGYHRRRMTYVHRSRWPLPRDSACLHRLQVRISIVRYCCTLKNFADGCGHCQGQREDFSGHRAAVRKWIDQLTERCSALGEQRLPPVRVYFEVATPPVLAMLALTQEVVMLVYQARAAA